jgi:hypothetical protein
VAGATAVGVPWLALVDGVASRIAGRPVKVRAKVTPEGVLRGRVDVLVVEAKELPVAGLLVDRVVVRAENVQVRPGLPPRLVAGPVGWKAVVTQASVDRWAHVLRLPTRLELTSEGILVRTGVAGVRMGEILTEIEPVGRLLNLRPRRASVLGMNAPAVGMLRGFLPLPPLPAGARIERVEHRDGELAVYLSIDDIDQALTPDFPRRIRKRFALG